MNGASDPSGPLASSDLLSFIHRHGRLPRVGDAPPPWTYRGWLLPYVIFHHATCPAVANRWDYHLRTLEAGRLLDEPIPPIRFGPPNNQVFSLLQAWSRLIGHDCGGWSDFRILLDWLCRSLFLCDEPPRLSDNVNEQLYRQVNLLPLLEQPHDYLGAYVAEGKSRGWNPTGFYPTPHSVVECMVKMTMHDRQTEGQDLRLRSVCDPCVGSGRMLLHASNLSLRLFGQDIDPLAVAMCKINGALYAPWLSFPLPASIVGREAQPSEESFPASGPSRQEVPVVPRTDGQGLLFPSC